MDLNLECVILSEKDYSEYEACLYKAFVEKGKNINFYVSNNYIVLENSMKPNCDYSNMKIFAIKQNGKIIAARAYNFNMKNTQIEKIGFTPELERNNSCESLHLFNLSTIDISSLIFEKLKNFIDSWMKANNFKFVYGACLSFHLKMYKTLGMTPILEKKRTVNNINFTGYVLKQVIE
jgi:hypothetical protein